MALKTNTALAVCILLIVFVSPAVRSTETSIVFLPSHIEALDGQVSLFADYGSIQTNGRVPVFLINKSPENLVLKTQAGDIYLKVQYQDTTGNWVRAQPHAYSWCGNSYWTRTLRPGHYVLVRGYQPVNGISRTIRYHLYSQDIEMSSNAGIGIVTDVDIKRASRDVLSINEGTLEYVSRVALSEVPVENKMDHMRDLRPIAILALASERFEPNESRKILLQVREKNPDMAKVIDIAIRRLDRRLSNTGVKNM